MRFLSLDSRLKRKYRAAYWHASLLTARATGHPSFAFFQSEVQDNLRHLRRVTVLPQRELIFLAIPKNANSKTKRIIAEMRGIRNPFFNSPSRKFRQPLSATDISIHKFYRLVNSPNRFSFAIVRDPYKRIVSAWANKFRGRPLVPGSVLHGRFRELNTYLRLRPSIDKSLPAGPDATLSFDQYLEYVSAIIGKWVDGHIEPQSRFLDIPFVPIDHLVRLESFSKDMLPVLDHMKAPASIAARLDERVNSSGLSENEYAITPAKKKKIEALYGEDIEKYGYQR